MADVLSFRMRQRPVRMAAAITTLAVSFFYLLAQMAGAGGLVALLLGVDSKTGQSAVIAVVGVLMIIYVLVGGMKGTTWVQIVKATLLITGAGVMTVWVLAKYGFNLSSLLGARSRWRERAARSTRASSTAHQRLDQDRLHLAVAGAGARHRRPAARADALLHGAHARRRPVARVVWAIWLIGIFYLFTLVLGYGAGGAGRAGDDRRRTRRGQLGSTAARLRARRHDPAGRHRRGGLRDDPRGRRRAHHHGGRVVRARHLRQRDQARARSTPDGPRSRWPDAPWSSSGSSRSSAASSPTGRTSPSWWRWRSPSRPAPTCRRSSTRCSGSGSTPAARCGACTAV